MAKGSRDPDYKGKAGELAAMSEFLLRGYNVAMPQVDEGDDILLLRNHDGDVRRVQVKTAVRLEGQDTGLFSIPRRQLITPVRPELCYVFAFRQSTRWDFIVLERKTVRDCLEEAGKLGDGQADAKVLFSLRFLPESVTLIEAGAKQPDLAVWRHRFDVM